MDRLVILAWNPYVRNRKRRVKRALRRWVKRHKPDVIVINEARPFYGILRDFHGYTTYQEKPLASRRVVPEQGNVAILVRNSHEVIRRKAVAMDKFWRVMRNNRWHTPRRYESVKARVRGRVWKVRGSHFPTLGKDGPNRIAWLESATRSKAWALISPHPTADVGDLNERGSKVRRFFGRGFRVFGVGIDLAVTRRVKRGYYKKLGKYGSDHNARLYVLKA